MQTYHVKLSAEASNSFRAKKAAQSVDLDIQKKLTHELKIDIDIKSDFNIGLIVGSSGTGKTTLAKKIFGEDIFDKNIINFNKCVIDQFPASFTYEECQRWLSGIGLTSIPCWLKPLKCLSNGQQARAIAALQLSHNDKITVFDEWTSVVDRTVAKVMSHSLKKFTNKHKKQIICLSCHFDIIEWLDPDWIVDLNKGTFTDRRLLRRIKRKETLDFTIRRCTKSAWKAFSKYHYLGENISNGRTHVFGLFHEENQIGIMMFSNYVPIRKHQLPIWHSNRVVLHPDYVGLGIGIKFVNAACSYFKNRFKVRVLAKLSAQPLIRSRLKDKDNWLFLKTQTDLSRNKVIKGASRISMSGKAMRYNVKTYTFEYIGK